MRANTIVLALFLGLATTNAIAQQTPEQAQVKGLFLLTDYPALTVQAGGTSTVALRLHNYGLPPERLALSVDGVPQGWSATILGGGQPVAAAMPATGKDVALQLRLDVPANAQTGATVTVNAHGHEPEHFAADRGQLSEKICRRSSRSSRSCRRCAARRHRTSSTS